MMRIRSQRLPERNLDNFLFLGGNIHCVRNLTGLFAQSPDVIVKCAGGVPVFHTPLAVGKPIGSAPGDQI